MHMSHHFLPLLAAGLLLGTVATAQTLPGDSVRDYSLDEFVVTGTGTLRLIKDAPVQTEVIDRKALKSFGHAPLSQILSGLIPSIDFSRSDMGTSMQMGGLSGGYVLILVDGKRLMGDLGGQVNLDVIDPTRIDRIEVIRGASSALYGSDAIAGVINIITRKSTRDLSLVNTTRIGSYGSVIQSTSAQATIGRVTSRTDFHLKHSSGWQNTTYEDPNRYEHPVTNSVNNTSNPYLDYTLGERLDWRPSKLLSAYLEGSVYRKDIHRPTGIPDYKTYDFRYRNASAATGIRWQLPEGHLLTADLLYDRHAYYYVYTGLTWIKEWDDKGKENSYPYYPDDVALQSDQQRLIGHLKGVLELPAHHRLSTGLDLQYNWLIAPYRLDRERVQDYLLGLYLQDEWDPVDRLNVTAGARLTYHPAFGLKLSPKLSLRYKVGPVNFRGTYSEGFKTPSNKQLHYRYVRQMGMLALYLGNEGLDAQSSRYLSGDIEYREGPLSLHVTGYANWLRNMITLVTVPRSEAPSELLLTYDPARVRMYKNMDSARTLGVDFQGKWQVLPSLALSAGYSYLDTDALLYDLEEETMKRVIIDGMAHHRGTIGLDWSRELLPDRYHLGVGLYGRMQSTRYYQDDGNGKPYNLWRINTRHDLTLSNSWRLAIDAGVDNIFDYYETTYHGLHYGTYTPGRTFYLSCTINFGKELRSASGRSRRQSTDDDSEE